MNKFLCLAFVVLQLLMFSFLLSFQAGAQDKKKAYHYPQKQLEALRVQEAPAIDGVLDEAVWEEALVATDFIQNRPTPGPLETHPTEVRVLYDDEALYIGAIMHDVAQDSILRQLGQRDDLGNTDFFGVFLDTYNDQINAFGFFLTPAGVQVDARYSSSGEDWSWNAVWESSAKLQGTDWIAEIKIPYSAIRFGNKQEQVWGLNFMRNRQATRQGFFWNYVDPAVDGFVNQYGKLVGLRNIESPLRLSLTPYVSGYAERYPYNKEGGNDIGYKKDFGFGGGLDVKYGINDAFTLDMTLIPDFSQVQSDNRVLNLGPFEQQFNENRPFFMEGTELFNKGDFFYSRRIGGTPINYLNVGEEEALGYRVVENPGETKMLNGTKISGRTQSGLGVGVFNALVARQYATLEDSEGRRFEKETQPLTNYNVTVLDQSLKNNSFITLVNTNVLRQGSTYDANLTGMLFRIANKENKYAVMGKGALSQRYFSDSTALGHSYNIGFGKVSGRFLFNVSHSVESDTYNPNDLGILFTNNSQSEELNFNYNFYQPFWKLLNLYTRLGAEYSRRYKPDTFQNFVLYGNVRGTFKNFTSAGLFFNLEPVETYDFFEPRVSGWYYLFPTNYNVGGWFSTDYRKRLALDVEMNYRAFDENNRHTFNYEIAPRFRVNDRLMFMYNYDSENRFDDIGYASSFEETVDGIKQQQIIFGLRDVNTVANTLSGSYIFNNRMSLSLRARHYWSKATYSRYYQLTEEGTLLLNSDYSNNHDVNFNAFNVDMVYSWWFAPGSQVTLVWKNAILEEADEVDAHYFDNLSHTLSSPQSTTFSIKVLYFLDYLTLKKSLSEL